MKKILPSRELIVRTTTVKIAEQNAPLGCPVVGIEIREGGRIIYKNRHYNIQRERERVKALYDLEIDAVRWKNATILNQWLHAYQTELRRQIQYAKAKQTVIVSRLL